MVLVLLVETALVSPRAADGSYDATRERGQVDNSPKPTGSSLAITDSYLPYGKAGAKVFEQ